MKTILLCLFTIITVITIHVIYWQKKEKYADNILSKTANDALIEYEDTTCRPFKVAAKTNPEIWNEPSVKNKTLYSYKDSPDICFLPKPTDPNFKCSKDNKALYMPFWQKPDNQTVRLGDDYRDSIHYIENGEAAESNKYGVRDVCLIKFDPYLRPEEALNYAKFLSTTFGK